MTRGQPMRSPSFKTKMVLAGRNMLCVLLLAGCSLAPDMKTVETSLPESYPLSTAELETDPAAPKISDIGWREYYKDEQIRELIEIGLENNSDVKTAALRIAEARALYGIEESALLPELGIDGGFTRQKNNAIGFSPDGGSRSFISQNYQVNFGMTAYEFDFFGRLRSLKDAALNEFFATQASLRSARLMLIADIATAYTSLRTNQALLHLAQETLAAREESFSLIKRRFEAGVATELELAQAESLLLQARVDMQDFVDSVQRDRNALRLLLGTPDKALDFNLPRWGGYFPDIMSDIRVGVPSELLTSRPDIAAAEYALLKANADIGAARAAFFPSVSLTSTAGYSSAELRNLFESSSQVWRFAPQISLPIFTAGRLQNNLRLSEVRKELAVVEYEATIERAFREVSDALSTAATVDARFIDQNALVEAAEKSLRLSEKRYEAGIDSYLAVLDAKRALYAARQNEIRIRSQKATNRIDLFRALGGGAFL